jgi:two-component system response regulator LytT
VAVSADVPVELGESDTIPVELGGVTRFVDRRHVTHVEAHGDYARLHTAAGSHLIRVPLTTLETEWAQAGFVRIHRSLLVALRHVTEIRMESGRCTVSVGPTDASTDLVVSRRHTRELRELLGRRS